MLRVLYAALEGLGSAIPAGLASIVWLGYKIGPELIAPMVFAMMCAVAITNASASFSRRPLVYAARFFETSLLAGFIDSFVPKLGGWGLVDSPSVRMSLVILACVVAGLVQPLFYGLRLQRMTRFIPAPVFAAFLNSVALILVMSQVKQVLLLASQRPQLVLPSVLIAAACLGLALVLRRFTPRLPAGILGLLAASLTALLLQAAGHSVPTMLPHSLQWVLPIAWFDMGIFHVSNAHLWAMLLDGVIAGALLGLVVFLSTVVSMETLSQQDDRAMPTLVQTMQISTGKMLSACLGSVPMSGTTAGTLAAARTGGLGPAMMPLMAALIALSYLLGVLSWVPQSAMIGLLLFEAYCMYDRGSANAFLRLLAKPSARHSMGELQREDLLIVVVVTFFGVVGNMVTALLVGALLGLVLFAKRNGKSPIKYQRSGTELRSNCARSIADTLQLDAQGERIQCIALQGALYFGMVRPLRAELEASIGQAQWLVLDWAHVVSQDSTLQRMLQRFEEGAAQRGVQVLHCARAGYAQALPDVDRALEQCENELLAQASQAGPSQPADVLSECVLMQGLDAPAQSQVRACFTLQEFAQGERVLQRGDPTRELLVLAQGSANVVIGNGSIRVAGMSAGAIVGEMGFLDGSPRAADVFAAEPLLAHVLQRERFDALSLSHPEIAQQMLQNLCVELASRLRSLHKLLARERG